VGYIIIGSAISYVAPENIFYERDNHCLWVISYYQAYLPTANV